MINEDCKDKDALALVKYISEDQREEKLLANQQVIKTPIVRNGKLATVGYAPEVWKGWVVDEMLFAQYSLVHFHF